MGLEIWARQIQELIECRTELARLRAEHSWDALAHSTIGLVDELKPARGWA